MKNGLTIMPHNLLNNMLLINKSERTAFTKFLRSPFHTQQPELLVLYRFLAKSFPNFFQEGNEIEEEKVPKALPVAAIFRAVYPDEAWEKTPNQQKTKVYNLCSDLNLAFEEFIAAGRQKEDRVRKYLDYLEFLKNKNNEALWRIGLRKFKKAIDDHGENLQTYHYRYLYHKMEFESPFFDQTNKQYAQEKLKAVFSAQNQSILLTQLTQACELVYRAEVIHEEMVEKAEDVDWEALLELAKPFAQADHPLLHLYFGVVRLKICDGKLAEFLETAALLKNYHRRIARQELNELVRYLLNYCTFNHNRGEPGWLSERLQLEKWAIDSGILLEDGLIPDGIFLNACLNAIAEEEYDLAREYIHRHHLKLEKRVRTSAVALVRAYIYFFEEKYELAEKELKKVSLQRHNFSIRKYLLLIRIKYHYFVIGHGGIDGYEMQLILENFKKFCHRNSYQIPKDRLKGYLHLQRLMCKMVDYRWEHRKKNDRQLQRIAADFNRQPLALRSWVTPYVNNLLRNGSDAAG